MKRVSIYQRRSIEKYGVHLPEEIHDQVKDPIPEEDHDEEDVHLPEEVHDEESAHLLRHGGWLLLRHV